MELARGVPPRKTFGTGGAAIASRHLSKHLPKFGWHIGVSERETRTETKHGAMDGGVHIDRAGAEMFRIMRTDEPNCSLLTVEGELLGDSVQMVEACCEEAIARGARVEVMLRDVSTIDPAGRALLRKLAERGVEVRGSGLYTSFLLRGLRGSAGQKDT